MDDPVCGEAFVKKTEFLGAMQQCCVTEECGNRCIPCASNWPCGKDCSGCPYCDQRVFFTENVLVNTPAKSCCGRGDQASRCILCPPDSTCGFDCEDNAVCE